jgi:hypothetical protein
MGRPRSTIGSFGEITTRILPSGRIEARTRYRDWDGRSRIVQATADTAKAAERALKKKLAGRSELQPASGAARGPRPRAHQTSALRRGRLKP